MHDDKVKAALAAMRRASAHHLLSSAEQAKLLAVAEAALVSLTSPVSRRACDRTGPERDLAVTLAALGDP